MPYRVTVLPQNIQMQAAPGETLLSVLCRGGLAVDAPCGGEGRCGKCRVTVDGQEALACRTAVSRDMTVTLPRHASQQILTEGIAAMPTGSVLPEDYALAFDIGTTTVVGYLLKGSKTLASAAVSNPQSVFGADVVTRIRRAVRGEQEALTGCIRACLDGLRRDLCGRCGVSPREICRLSIVGNPAMRQLFLGVSVENLAKVPFAPALTRSEDVPAADILPVLENARLSLIPDIAGFVGTDTVACVLATGMDMADEPALLVDIGTNGEMVLGCGQRMVACSAAAGPALEGAGIRFGMRGRDGAIDHVCLENGQLRCSVIGGGTAQGICGSGLIDAVAAALDAGWLNPRGKILTEDGLIHLTESVYLTQEDIRQVQLAKGAIAAGILLMADHMGIALQEIRKVYLAGAFGTYMNPKSACRIGLLPRVPEDRIAAVGNAAGSGAKMLAYDPEAAARAQRIAVTTEALELSTLPGFARSFAACMRF